MSVTFKAGNIQKHAELASKIKETLVVDGTSVKEKESHSAYLANLPEGQTPKSIEELVKYNSKFVTASHVAVGEIAAEIFSKNKTAMHVDAEVGFFGKDDNINIGVDRTKTFHNHLAKDPAAKDVVKHLVMQTTVTSAGVKGSGLKAVRESMSEEFSGMFKK